MAISLFGIIVVQVLWIRHAVRAEEARFDQSVFKALTQGISRIEREKMFHFIDRKIELPTPAAVQSFDSMMNMYIPEVPEIDVLINDSGIVKLRSGPSVILVDSIGKNRLLAITKPGHRSISWETDSDTDSEDEILYTFDFDVDVLEEQEDELPEPERLEELEEIRELNALHNILEVEKLEAYHKALDSLHDDRKRLIEVRTKKENVVRRKMKEFNKNMQQWAFEYSFDEDQLWSKRFQNDIDSVISRALRNNGVELDFVSQITREAGDTTIIIKSSDGGSVLLDKKYRSELFPEDYFSNHHYLTIEFPGRTSHIYRSVSLLGFGSLAFTLIILVTFGMTLYYIQKQKKLSDIKSDFINNMTHEFKTPIATISLASDAMDSPKVFGKEEQTKYYLNIIRQENKRMNNQVERVLQMALIENEDFHLDLQKTDLHSIIENTIKAVDLAAKEKKGRIQSSLRATCSKIPVDEIHFANILNNLLDNALKYCEKEPDILVETFSADNKIYLRISDNGVGMSKEVQKYIFDKFYRRPSGNIHNVKGFGLGLSYVKAIVEAHGGEISVTSEPGNGSIFTLGFNCQN